jgi:hypothetical protein
MFFLKGYPYYRLEVVRRPLYHRFDRCQIPNRGVRRTAITLKSGLSTHVNIPLGSLVFVGVQGLSHRI